MPRDRLGELREAQSDDDDGLDEVGVNVEGDRLEGFFADVDEINESLSMIEGKVNHVKQLHSTILSAPQTDDKAKQELEDAMSYIKKTANKVRAKLKVIEQNIEQEEAVNKTATNVRIRRMHQTSLSRTFVKIMVDYNKTQEDYRENCKAQIKRQLDIKGQTACTDEQLDEMLNKNTSALFTDGILMDTNLAKQQVADIEQRHADIVKLETSIKELHELFTDMAILVESQGEMIDRIENHVEHAVDYVQTATTDTKKALKYQSKARRKKFMILGCVIAAAGVIALIIYLSSSS